MSVSTHLGIKVSEYDARIKTFIPHYREMLDVAARAVTGLTPEAPVVIDLGIGSGALAARCLAAKSASHIVGIDSDEGMLAMARRRLGRRLTPLVGDFITAPLPRADAITASFALHHVRDVSRKKALYARCYRALRRGGIVAIVDRFLASHAAIEIADRRAWREFLLEAYTPKAADRFLRSWEREDVYRRLDDEIDWLRASGLRPNVIWRHDGFGVIVAQRR